jgi:hypothetical protein
MSGRGTGPHGKVRAYIDLPPAAGGGGEGPAGPVIGVGIRTDLLLGYDCGPTPWKVWHQPTPEPDEQQWPEPHGENF